MEEDNRIELSPLLTVERYSKPLTHHEFYLPIVWSRRLESNQYRKFCRLPHDHSDTPTYSLCLCRHSFFCANKLNFRCHLRLNHHGLECHTLILACKLTKCHQALSSLAQFKSSSGFHVFPFVNEIGGVSEIRTHGA